jgi:hypothetical protein
MVEKTIGTFYEHISSHMQTLCVLSNMLDLWKWTKKKPSPNKGKGLDVHFCFNFYTPHSWPNSLGDKCAQLVFKCVKKIPHQTRVLPPPPLIIYIKKLQTYAHHQSYFFESAWTLFAYLKLSLKMNNVDE